MTSAVLKLSPVEAPAAALLVDRRMTVTEILRRVEAPDWFFEVGVCRLDGEVIPREMWGRVAVKPGTDAILDLCVVPQGRNAFALLATVATVALAASVSGGLLAPLGATFTLGGLGATLAAAGVGISGQLLASALTAPPKLGNDAQQRGALSQAGVSQNPVPQFGTLPVVFGTFGLSPPLLAPVYTTLERDEVTVHAVCGVQGRCSIANMRINGVDYSEIDRLEIETREGYSGDAARTIANITVIEERDGTVLSNFRTELRSTRNDYLLDQATPANSSPDWHHFRTAGEADEVWFRLLFPAGIVDSSVAGAAIVPIRLECRKVGDVSWRAFPTIHCSDIRKGSGPMRAQIKVKWQTPPSGPQYSYAGDEWPIMELTGITGWGQSFEYEADSYFLNAAWDANGTIPVMTAATTSGVTMSASSEFSGTYAAWKSADAGGSTYWRPAANSLPGWIKIDFGSATTLRSWAYTADGISPGAAEMATEVYVEGSNDDATYTRLDAGNIEINVDDLVWCLLQIGTPGSYRYYKFHFVANNGAASEDLHVLDLRTWTDDAVGSQFVNDGLGLANEGFAAFNSASMDPRCVHGSLDEDGATFWLDPAEFIPGEYEFRMKRGLAFQYGDFLAYDYSWTGVAASADFFDYRLNGADYVIRVGQKNFRSDAQVEVFSTVNYDEPFMPDGIALIAISVPNIVVDSIYGEFTSYAEDYGGATWDSTESATANPASLYRRTLQGGGNPDPVPDAIIDEDELADWFDRCVTAGHQCNAVVTGRSVRDVLQMIAAAGYASPRQSNLWGVVEDYDTSAEPVVGAITPLNGKDLGTELALPNVPHAIRAGFADEDALYEEKHVIVYRDGYTSANATLFETVSYPGFTEQAKVEERALFDMNQALLRAKRYAREVGFEGYTLRRGSLVRLVDDILDSAQAFGLVRSITSSGGVITAVTLDAIMPWSANTTASPMGLAIRLEDGSEIIKAVTNTEDGKTATFATPFTDTGDVVAGLLAGAGLLIRVGRRCKVISVEPTGIETRRITLADEAPELFGGTAPFVSPAMGLLGDAASGMAIAFKYASMAVVDAATPANNFDGLPQSKLTVARASAATVWSSGVLVQLANNTLAYEQDPNSFAPLGVRVEGIVTNLCTYSEDFSNVAWIKSQTTVTANAAVASDGNTTADDILEDSSTARHAIGKNSVTVTANATYALSFHLRVKAGSATRYPVLYMTNAAYQAADRAGMAFDLATLTAQAGSVNTSVAAPAVVGGRIDAIPGSRYRLSFAGSIGGGDGSIGFFLSQLNALSNANVGNSFTGDTNTGWRAWGAQIEDGRNFASSYVPATGGSSGVKAADAITLPLSSINYSSSTGTLVVRARTAKGAQGSQVLLQIDDGSESHRYRIERNASREIHFITTRVGVDVVDENMGVVADDTEFNIAAAWALNDFAVSLNGGALEIDGTAALPVGCTTLRIGQSFTGEHWYGTISEVRHFPVQVSDDLVLAFAAT